MILTLAASEISQNGNNPAWALILVALITTIGGYFTYRKLPMRKKRDIPRARNATTFEELQAVVDILQNELDQRDRRERKKDERHDKEITRLYRRIDGLEGEKDTLYKKVDHLQDILRKQEERLNRAGINHVKKKDVI